MTGTPRLIAHRGASADAPENTLAALRLAHEQGASWVEVDCMLTRDGVAVLHHDETLARVAGLEAAMADLDHAELAGLDAGSWFDPRFAGERIPTLEAAIALLGRLGLGANVEIKPTEGRAAETAEAVCRILVRRWPAHLPRPVVSSFAPEALAAARPLIADRAEIAMLVGPLPDDWRARAEALGAIGVHAGARRLGARAARDVRGAGFALRAYTVNDPAEAARLFGWGVQSVFTDAPARMAARLQR